ncbi:glycerol-3-phosphate acyltransferase, partial [Trifolium medium]|nr:glycerol-3-phosphate acyltransferase [Trifolium medium]
MLDDPELIEIKRKENTQSLKEMATLLRSASQIIWIAPSGGTAVGIDQLPTLWNGKL